MGGPCDTPRAIFAAEHEGQPLAAGTGTVDFGSILVGSASPSETISLLNTGRRTLTINSVTPGGAFSLISAAPGTITENSSEPITLEMDTTTPGPAHATLSIMHSDADQSPFEISLSGLVTAPRLTVNDADDQPLISGQTLDIGSKEFGGLTLQYFLYIYNSGDSELTVSDIQVDAPYSIVSSPTTALLPGTTRSISVELPTNAYGTFDAQLTITCDAYEQNTFTLNITGTITSPADTSANDRWLWLD